MPSIMVRGEVHPVPCRRGAGAREERAVRHHRGKLELFAADALGLMDAKERFMEIAQRLVGQPAELFAFRRALLQDRQQRFSFSQVPVKNLFSGPQCHARPLADVFVKPLEIDNAMRRAGDVRMHADRHYTGGLLAVGIQPVEVIDAAAQPFSEGWCCSTIIEMSFISTVYGTDTTIGPCAV